MKTIPNIDPTIRRPAPLCEAAIELLPDESMTGFQSALSDALAPVVGAIGLLAIDDEGTRRGDYYVTDIKPGVAIARIYNYGGGPSAFLSFPWVRGRDGAFAFGAPVEVTPVTTYTPTPDKNRVFDLTGGGGAAATAAPVAVVVSGAIGDATLPASAFAAPFLAGPDGAYNPAGTFNAGKSRLPFQVRELFGVGVGDPSFIRGGMPAVHIDPARLRNAIATVESADLAAFGTAVHQSGIRATAKARLNAVAESVMRDPMADAGVKTELRAVLAESCRETVGAIRRALASAYVRKDADARMNAERLAESALRDQGPFDGVYTARLALDLSDLRRGAAATMLSRQAKDGL